MIAETEWSYVRTGCIEVFDNRSTHPWPPQITIPDSWHAGCQSMAVEIGFEIVDVVTATAAVHTSSNESTPPDRRSVALASITTTGADTVSSASLVQAEALGLLRQRLKRCTRLRIRAITVPKHVDQINTTMGPNHPVHQHSCFQLLDEVRTAHVQQLGGLARAHRVKRNNCNGRPTKTSAGAVYRVR
jgi:hypothetical protein